MEDIKIRECMVRGIARHSKESNSVSFCANAGCLVKGEYYIGNDKFIKTFAEITPALLVYAAKKNG